MALPRDFTHFDNTSTVLRALRERCGRSGAPLHALDDGIPEHWHPQAASDRLLFRDVPGAVQLFEQHERRGSRTDPDTRH